MVMENNKKIEIPVPQDQNSLTDQFINFIDIVKILRKECPWDNKQTNESIAYLMIEEVYEMIDSIENKNDFEFSKELGDLFLHIIMHSVMAEERGAFNLVDVMKKIQEKLITRHPHVFGNVNVNNEMEVMENWEAIKMKEGQKSVLQGVPKNMPSLLRAERIQHKASRIGFDWENRDGAWEKVYEEINELREELNNSNKEKIINEIQRVSRSGLRIYKPHGKIGKVYGGLGISIITTSKGILTDKQCREQKIGGEILCQVW